MERLDKIISNQTTYTRKEVKDLIKKKRITVNDKIITKSDIKINQQLKLADCKPYGNSPSREAVQTPAHTISKQGLGREARRGLHRLE